MPKASLSLLLTFTLLSLSLAQYPQRNFTLVFITERYNYSTMGNISFYDHFALVRAGFFLGIQRANVDLAPYNVTLKPVILYGSTALETLRAGIQAVTSYQDLIGVICNGISLSSSDSGVNLYPYLSSLQINTISTFGINSDFIFKGSAPYLFRSFPSIVSVVQNFMKLSNLLGINNIGLIFDPTQISSESIRLANFTSRIIAAAPLSSADAGFPISYTLVYQALFLLKQSGAKAILITYSHFILNFYLAAQDLGMLTNEYTFFILNYFPTSMTPYQWRGCVFYSPLKSKNNAERSKLAAAFGVASTNDSNSMFYDPCFGKSTGGASLGCNVRITFTYDNVVIFSKAILAAIVANQDPSNPDVLRSFIRLTEYIGKNQFRTGFTSNQDGNWDNNYAIEFEGRKNVNTPNNNTLIAFSNSTSEIVSLIPGVNITFGSNQTAALSLTFDDGSLASRTLSTLSGLTLASGQVGIDNPITLKTLNSYNEVYNFNDSSSLNVTLSFLNGTIANAATKVIYVSPGVSTITYRPPVVETFSLSVKLRGEDFPGSPFQISAVKLCSSGCWNGVCKTNGICACNIGYTGTICGTQFPLTTADISTSIGLVSFFLGILGLCTTVSGTVLIWVFRRGKFVRAGSPPCLAVIGLGLSIWSLYPIFVPLASSPFYPHSTIPCWLAPMFYHLGKSKSKLGFTISFVALLIKNIRIVMIFGAELKQISVITNNMVYAYTFLATSVIALIFGLWQGLSPTRSIIISDYTSNTLDCVDSSYSWPIALYVLEMIILFANGLVSFQARKIKNDIYAESKTIAATTYTISVLLLIFMFMLQKPLSFALVTQINTTIHFLCPFIASIFLFYWKIYNYISGREIKVLQPKESSINLEVSSNSSKKSTSIFKVLPSKCFNVKGKRLGFQGMIHTEMEDLLITVLHSSKKMIFVSHVNGAWSVGFSIANDGDVGKMFQKTVVQGQNFGSAVLNSRSGSFLISDSIEVLDQLYDAISDAIAGNDKSESLSVSKDGYGSKGASHNVKSINATSEMAGAN